ncbi:hypothetical protein CDIK_2707 [Cucumispora dikerogammari]|nr:hypothetical protein CDIK_2707 [Cucumispora dikerogammari]
MLILKIIIYTLNILSGSIDVLEMSNIPVDEKSSIEEIRDNPNESLININSPEEHSGETFVFLEIEISKTEKIVCTSIFIAFCLAFFGVIVCVIYTMCTGRVLF